MQLVRLPATEAAVGGSEVVEHKQLAWLEIDEYLGRFEAKATRGEVPALLGDARELLAAETFGGAR